MSDSWALSSSVVAIEVYQSSILKEDLLYQQEVQRRPVHKGFALYRMPRYIEVGSQAWLAATIRCAIVPFCH